MSYVLVLLIGFLLNEALRYFKPSVSLEINHLFDKLISTVALHASKDKPKE